MFLYGFYLSSCLQVSPVTSLSSRVWPESCIKLFYPHIALATAIDTLTKTYTIEWFYSEILKKEIQLYIVSDDCKSQQWEVKSGELGFRIILVLHSVWSHPLSENRKRTQKSIIRHFDYHSLSTFPFCFNRFVIVNFA